MPYSKNCHPNNTTRTKCSCLSRAAMNRIVKDIKHNSWSKVNIFKNYTNKSDCDLFKLIQNYYNEESPLNWNTTIPKPFYRPEKDTHSKTLYTTEDITKILKQFEKKYRSFQSFGAVPDDFCQYFKEVCNLNLNQLKKTGKTKIAIVFNTDPLDEPGEHWVMLWIHITKKNTTIAYFDSEGQKPSENVQRLINKLSHQDKNATILNVVKKPHQLGGNQCGVYTVYFVERLLQGASINSLNGNINRISNKMMTDYSINHIFPNNLIK